MSAPARRAPAVNIVDIVFPMEANHYGSMFGGNVVALMDKAAYLAAVKFARMPFVTISIDGVQFIAPVRVGDIVEAHARVAFVGRTSLIVRVNVFRESPHHEGQELATEGWVAMAARTPEGAAAELPPLQVETSEERALEAAAKAFRDRSKAARG